MKRPPDRRGIVATGRISRLLVGQAQGFIRLADGRDIFFHRADMRDGYAFNALRPGDLVTFELLEDTVSGARATRVMRKAQG